MAAAHTAETAESRAVEYLAVEVPKWTKEHDCLSCHNNGDATRALMAAVPLGYLKDRAALADTLRFLGAPATWDANGPDGPFKDQKLARIQFAAALTDGNVTGVLNDRAALAKAAALVAELQAADGSWQIDAVGNLGSPVTYGRHLATVMATRTLVAAHREQDHPAISKAEGWLLANPAKSVLDAAATLWGLAGVEHEKAAAERERCWQLIRSSQSTDGGWGPFVTSPPEVFDTAIALLALRAQTHDNDMSVAIERGRAYLIAEQRADGSWPATTRPSGAESYAQQLSTTGWALQALLATRPTATR